MDVATSCHYERRLPARPDDVYGAWLDGARLASWLHLAPGVAAHRARVDPAPGGGFELDYTLPQGGDIALRGRWLELRPGRRVRFELRQAAPRGERTSTVTVDLVPDQRATILRLCHEGLQPDDRARVDGVWRHSLGRLIGACRAAIDAYYGGFRVPEGGYHSPFGGLWPDRLDADAVRAGKVASGQLDAADERLFRDWQRDGYVVLPQAVAPGLIDDLRDEIARHWRHGHPDVAVELTDGSGRFVRMGPEYEAIPHKVLDYHAVSRLARDVVFAPAIRRFVTQLFERAPMAFQSLLFEYGTEQEMHQDTGYVVVRSPMEFVGCWIALEDIAPGSGELQYYAGSHTIPEYLWLGRGRGRPPGFEDDREFLAWVRRHCEQRRCELVRFPARKGDALLWHADLVHGGSKRTLPGRTRWSLVTHFCPVDVDPEWMERVPHSGRLEHAPGCHYCHVTPSPVR